MMQSSDFKHLIVWQKAFNLVSKIYDLTRILPEEEKFGLFSQMRRCAVSIPSNIAEGQGRYHKREFVHFLHFARGSAAELETQLLICLDQGYVSKDCCETLIKKINEVSLLIVRLINSLENNPKT